MAKQISSKLAQTLKCAVCLDVFTDPVELKCRHTFCKVCVARLIGDGRIDCPTCRTVTPEGDFLNDFKMAEMVSILHGMHATNDSSAGVMCVLCDHLLAEIHCNQCKKLLCPTCSKTHRKYENCSESSSMPIAEIENKFASQVNRELHRVSDWLKFVDSEKQFHTGVVDQKEEALRDILDKLHVKSKTLEEKYFTKCLEKYQCGRDFINAAFAHLAKDGKDHQSFLKDCQKKSSLSEKIQLLQSNSFDKRYDCELPIPHHPHYRVMIKFKELATKEYEVQEVGTDLVLEGQIKKILALQDGNFAVLCKTRVYLITNIDNSGFTYRKFDLETKDARSMTLTSDNNLLIATSDCGLAKLSLPQKWEKSCEFQVQFTGNFIDVTAVDEGNVLKMFVLKVDESCNNDASVVSTKQVCVHKLISAKGSNTLYESGRLKFPVELTLNKECATTCAWSNNYMLILDGNYIMKIGDDGVVKWKDDLVMSNGGVPSDLQFTTSIATKEVFIVNKHDRQVHRMQFGVHLDLLSKVPLQEVKDDLLPQFESVAKLTNNAWVIGCQLSEATFKFQIVMECGV